ncbi:MAG: ATP-binding cassette domain-containing protein [Leisingera sp.]
MVGRDLEPKKRQASATGPARLVLENITVGRKGQKPELSNISLTIHQGEIFGIAGVAGNSQNPLMEVIAGVRTPASGRITLDGDEISGLSAGTIKDMGLGHIPDDRFVEGLVPELSIEENLILGDHRGYFARGGMLDFPKMRVTAEQMIKEFQISAPSAETPAGNLSGGNAQRVILAREKRLATRVLLAN